MFETVGAKPALHQRIKRGIAAALLAASRSLESPGLPHGGMPWRRHRNEYLTLTLTPHER